MIKIEKLRFKNFLSSGNTFTEIRLDEHDVLLIVGPNGSGKSTVLDALSFGFYGKPFRNVNKPQLVNSITKRNCLVEIEFSIGSINYLVRRGMLPVVFEVIQDGNLLNQEAHSKDYQEILEKNILKIGHKAFCQVVILGAATFKPFMTLPAAQRREVIEDLLDLQVFSSMNSLLKEKIQDNNLLINSFAGEQRTLEDKIAFFNEQIRVQKINMKEIVSSKNQKIEHLKMEAKLLYKEMSAYKEEIETLTLSISGVEDIKNRKEEASKVQWDIELKGEMLRADIEYLQAHTVCISCGQDINEKFKQEQIEIKKSRKKIFEGGVAELQKKIDHYRLKLGEIGERREEIADLKYKFNNSKNRATLLYSQISELESEIENLSEEKEVDFTGLKETEDAFKHLKIAIKDCNDNKEILSAAAVLLKDNGIKAKIIKQFIPLMNDFVNKYLEDFESFWDFELDENFNEIFRSRYLDEFSYESFSQGERQKIDLSLLFAWREIAKLRNSVSTNLLILDEVFDNHTDDASVEHLISVVQAIAKNNNIIIISHKNATVERFDNILRIEKKKNFSRII